MSKYIFAVVITALIALAFIGLTASPAEAHEYRAAPGRQEHPHFPPWEPQACWKAARQYKHTALVAVQALEHKGCGDNMRRKARRHGVNQKVLAYVNAIAANKSQASGLPESAFAHRGGERWIRADGKHVMNAASPAWQQRLLSIGRKQMRICNCDGLWVDEAGASAHIWGSMYGRPNPNRTNYYYAAKRWQRKSIKLVRSLKPAGYLAINAAGSGELWWRGTHFGRTYYPTNNVRAVGRNKDGSRIPIMAEWPGMTSSANSRRDRRELKGMVRSWDMLIVGHASHPGWTNKQMLKVVKARANRRDLWLAK